MNSDEDLIGPLQFLVLVLTSVLLPLLLLDLCLPLPTEVSRLIQWADTGVCLVLLGDFSLRFRRAPSKRAFMKLGWIDLLASIPTVDILRLGRLLRVLRILRALRATRSLQHFLSLLYHRRLQGGLMSLALLLFLLLTLASIAILFAEDHPRANIRTAGDALWWSLATISTVGYGDCYPVTDAGRVIGGFLMLAGIGLFAALSGFIASSFHLRPPPHRNGLSEFDI